MIDVQEINKQIWTMENAQHVDERITNGMAQDLIKKLGGDLVVHKYEPSENVCYYLTLLLMRKIIAEKE